MYIILALSIILHSYHLAYPAWDYHNWRQSITLMVARDFASRGFHVLHPRVAWVSHDRPADPSYFSAEFSIMSILTAALYKIFGENNSIPRLVVISFSLIGIWALYDLLQRRAGLRPAWIAAFIYAVLPFQLFFGRVFMPEIPAQALGLAGLDALDRWTIDRRWRTLLAAAFVTAMALLQKLTMAFVLLPALFLFWRVYGKNLFTHTDVGAFIGIAGVPTVLWYRHAAMMAQQSGFAIMQPGVFGRHLGLWLQASFVKGIADALCNEALSPIGIALALVGMLWSSHFVAWIFRLWITGAALVLFAVPELLPSNHYYLAVLLPGAAALAGLALGTASRWGYPVLMVVLAALAIGSVRCAIPLYADDRAPYDLGVLLGSLGSEDDLLVTETGGSPNVLYYAGMRGWMLSGIYDPAVVRKLADSGGRYYANVFDSVTEGRVFFTQMDQLFRRLTGDGAPWRIYDLTRSSSISLGNPKHSARKMIPSVNFGDQIEFRGASLRRLLHKPAAFELMFQWRSFRNLKTGWHGFLHVIGSDGRTVYQQDHWPLGVHVPTNQWKPGEIIREQYILVLPEALPAGKYQLRLGWYDPLRQSRLPILDPVASDGQERATVAEVETFGPRTFHWLDVR